MTCAVFLISIAITFGALAYVYEHQPVAVQAGWSSTDIGAWGSGNSTASIKMCTRNQAFLGATCPTAHRTVHSAGLHQHASPRPRGARAQCGSTATWLRQARSATWSS
jgi:hypothetical protein